MLLANVQDAEKALTTVSKDKDQLLAFIRSVETSLHQATKHLKLLSESGSGSVNDPVLPLNLAQLISAQHRRFGKQQDSKLGGENEAEDEGGGVCVA